MTSATESPIQRSLKAFPGGSNGEFNLPPELSIVIERGQGCELWDSDGRHYLDFSMGWGSVLVGHANPTVSAAVREQTTSGSNFAYVTRQSLELAEELLRVSPACDRVRFCASGTEATLYCLRLARAFRGRDRVMKFEGAYHGAHEVGVTSLFPERLLDFPQPDPSDDSVRASARGQMLVAPYNDLETTRTLIAQHAEELAAVIVEPLQRCTPPRPGFLEGLREATREHGVLLIFDEVVTGFRLAYGGAQEYYGVVPDLVAYGKALGGGYPIGAYGGRTDVMNLVQEERLGREPYVWAASTLGGNPVSTTAASAALTVFREPGTYEKLHALGATLREGLTRALTDAGHTAQIIGDGPLAQVVFSPDPVFDYRSTRRGDRAKARALMLELFRRGVFLNPMGTKLYLSIAHTSDTCDAFLAIFRKALATL